MNVVWLPHALVDLDAQIEHIATNNPKAALGQLDQIERQVDLLANQPEMGRIGRVSGTRELVISRSPFIVIYRLNSKAKGVEILRVLHGAQKWP